ncbi:MAG TPA: glycosyltransferase family A protein [Patescibacteria group bacterium]|nr:glycosyltransferase family A protein [Patescibacteria group bacterium]
MAHDNSLTLSIVIPVYNEQRYIKACLEAIAAQTIKPLEVIVVDNNSIDKTVEIAQKFPFVRVIKEPKQGRGYARSAGFDAARGDIIGRIDADSLIYGDWAERVIGDFKDDNIGGITGLGKTNVILGLPGLYTTFWSRVYFWTTHSLFRADTMWGANMAIRKSTWVKAREAITLDDSIVHEDQDLSMVVLGLGMKIIQDNDLLIMTSGRSYLYWPKFWEYFKRTFKTKNYHLQKNTIAADSPLRLSFFTVLPGAIIGWALTGVFIVYSFVSWPIFALTKYYNKKARQIPR